MQGGILPLKQNRHNGKAAPKIENTANAWNSILSVSLVSFDFVIKMPETSTRNRTTYVLC